MHSLSVSVCPCLSETVCSYLLHGHMLLHCSDMLLCPKLQLKTASSSSSGGSPTIFFNSKYLLHVCVYNKPHQHSDTSLRSSFSVNMDCNMLRKYAYRPYSINLVTVQETQ